MRKYRFFYHYNKAHDKMTVHFRDTCYIVDSVTCMPSCATKRNRRQPRLVMQGFAKGVTIDRGMAVIV